MTDAGIEPGQEPEREIDRKIMVTTSLYVGDGTKVRVVRLFDMTAFRTSQSPYASDECESHIVELVKGNARETLSSDHSLGTAQCFLDGFVVGWKRRSPA